MKKFLLRRLKKKKKYSQVKNNTQMNKKLSDHGSEQHYTGKIYKE